MRTEISDRQFTPVLILIRAHTTCLARLLLPIGQTGDPYGGALEPFTKIVSSMHLRAFVQGMGRHQRDDPFKKHDHAVLLFWVLMGGIQRPPV